MLAFLLGKEPSAHRGNVKMMQAVVSSARFGKLTFADTVEQFTYDNLI